MDWRFELVVVPVSDVDRAKALFQVDQGGQAPGPDPNRADYGSFMSFSDPDGNGWLVQEVRGGKPEGK